MIPERVTASKVQFRIIDLSTKNLKSFLFIYCFFLSIYLCTNLIRLNIRSNTSQDFALSPAVAVLT